MKKNIKILITEDETGYALISVLMIGFLVISLLLGFLSIRYFSFILSEKRLQKKKLELACYSAVQKHLTTGYKGSTEGHYIANIDSVSVKVDYRLKGLFYEVTARAKTKRDSSSFKCYFASKVDTLFENALVISRPELNAAYAGTTKITGDILSTGSRITKGNIYGLRNENGNFLDGKIKVSKAIKDKYFPEKIISDEFNFKIPQKGAKSFKGNLTLSFADLDTISSLFIAGDLTLYGSGSRKAKMTSSRLFVTGKVVINENSYCSKDIEIFTDSVAIVKRNSSLEDIIITAKKGIRVESGTVLKCAQLFSGKYIKTDNSLFKYPSVLCLYTSSKDTSSQNKIELRSTKLNGTALVISDVTGIWGNKSKILVDEKSTVQGVIYSENNCEIKGKVIGAVYTYNLLFYFAPTEYINWLVNLDINRHELDKSYLLPIGLGEKGSALKALKEEWIY